MKSIIIKIAQIVITLALLTLVFHQVGLFSESGRREFLALIKQADITFLLLSIGISVLANMSSTLKWYMLARARAMVVSYWRLFAYYLVGQFYNLILPTSVGGDVVRSYELGKYTGKRADALASVFVERYTGLIMLLIMALLAMATSLSILNQGLVKYSLFAFALGLGLLGWFVLDGRLYNWLKHFLSSRFTASSKLFTKLDKFMDAVLVYQEHRMDLVWAMLNSFIFYLIAVMNVYLTAKVFEVDVQWVDMLIATPIIMLIMNIPLSIGNLGLMEFAYISIFQLMGYSPALALSVAVLMRLKSLIDGAMGGVLYPIYTSGNQRYDNKGE